MRARSRPARRGAPSVVRRDGRGDGELDVTAAQTHVDRPGREVAGDLAGRVRERVEDREACGRIERGGQPAGDLLRLGSAGCRRGQKLALQ